MSTYWLFWIVAICGTWAALRWRNEKRDAMTAVLAGAAAVAATASVVVTAIDLHAWP